MCGPTRSPHFLLIDTRSETNLDRDVIPAAIEFVVHDLVLKRMKAEAVSGRVCLLSIDRPVRHFERLSKRGIIRVANVLDCYTSWYEEWISTTPTRPEASIQKLWHIASKHAPGKGNEAVLQAAKAAFANTQRSQSHRKIVVIDSLSSILSISPGLDTVLHLLDSFSVYDAKDSNSSPPITLVATIRSNQLKSSMFESLWKLANTHVIVDQLSLKQNMASPSNMGDDRDFVRINVRKRRPSGRMHFEEHITKMDWESVQLHEIENGLEGLYSQRGEKEQNKKEENMSLELAQHGLSFRVTLSSKEREVRAAAGLPYFHTDEELANSALAIHPENLRLRKQGVYEIEEDSSDSSEIGSDGEDLFSEDV